MDAKIDGCSCFFEEGENARNYLFYNRKRGSGHLKIDEKSIQNPSKIDAKQNMQKVWKMRQKWSENGNNNGSEIRLWRFGAGFWVAWIWTNFQSSKNEATIWKKTEIWSPEGSDELFLGGRAEAFELCKDLYVPVLHALPPGTGAADLLKRAARTPPGHICYIVRVFASVLLACWFFGLWFERYFACWPDRLMIWLVGSISQKDRPIEIQKKENTTRMAKSLKMVRKCECGFVKQITDNYTQTC